jgi:hypothetical protein
MVAAMDQVGIDGAIFISFFHVPLTPAMPWKFNGPISQFGIVKPVEDDPAVADVVADWKNTPGTVRIPSC